MTPEQHALALANKIRAWIGKDEARHLSQGSRGEGCSCPIANTVDLERDGWGVWVERGQVKVTDPGVVVVLTAPIPDEVVEFIHSFDRGDLPHLVEPQDTEEYEELPEEVEVEKVPVEVKAWLKSQERS